MSLVALVLRNDNLETNQMPTHYWMDEQTQRHRTAECHSAMQRMRYWDTTQRGRDSKTLCRVKEVRHKTVHPHHSLYISSKHVKLVDGDRNHKYDQRGGGVPGQGHRGTFWGDGNKWYPERAAGYMSGGVYQNFPHGTLKNLCVWGSLLFLKRRVEGSAYGYKEQ